jgi:hypothetical protein
MNVQPQQLTTFAPILKKLNKKYHTVIADEDSLGSEVCWCRSTFGQKIMFCAKKLNINSLSGDRWLLNWSKTDFQESVCYREVFMPLTAPSKSTCVHAVPRSKPQLITRAKGLIHLLSFYDAKTQA